MERLFLKKNKFVLVVVKQEKVVEWFNILETEKDVNQMTNYDKGEAALKAYVDSMLESTGQGWKEWWIPESAFASGSKDAIDAATASKDQSATGRQLAAEAALRNALNAANLGGQVTDTQIAAGAAAI